MTEVYWYWNDITIVHQRKDYGVLATWSTAMSWKWWWPTYCAKDWKHNGYLYLRPLPGLEISITMNPKKTKRIK